MDTQNYKDSGILELYVMEALTAEEMIEVERRAAVDPAIAREIREIRESLALLDRHYARAPRRELRRSVLDAIERADAADRTVESDRTGEGDRTSESDRTGQSTRADESDRTGESARIGQFTATDAGERGGILDEVSPPRQATVIPLSAGTSGTSATAAGSAGSPTPGGGGSGSPSSSVGSAGPAGSTAGGAIYELPRTRNATGRSLLAASWILVALSLGTAAFFGLQWRSAAEEAELLREENRQLAGANSVIASRAENAERAMAIMRSADYHAVQLNGTEHAPAVHPVVYWNPNSHEVVLIAKNLPMPPPGKQYQLWAIHDGHRIDAGTFDVDGRVDTMQRLKDVDAAEAFAVTLEREGGSPVPDLTSVYAVGSL